MSETEPKPIPLTSLEQRYLESEGEHSMQALQQAQALERQAHALRAGITRRQAKARAEIAKGRGILASFELLPDDKGRLAHILVKPEANGSPGQPESPATAHEDEGGESDDEGEVEG